MNGKADDRGQKGSAIALRKANEGKSQSSTRASGARRSGAEANRRKADAFVEMMMPAIELARSQGSESCNAIAWNFNQQALRTARNGAWTGAAVRALLSRAERIRAEKEV